MSTGTEIGLMSMIKDAPKILETVYSDLAQPGVRKVGSALETVLEFSTSFLLPLKLLNHKFKLNFEKRLNEYKEKIENIPDEDLCKVNPQIGTPIIEKLSYTTNEEIADLFTSLLKKASSYKTENLAHPSFVQLIERLSVDEARIIKYLKNQDFIPCISFRAHFKEKRGFTEILKKGTLLSKHIQLLFPENIDTYMDNLVGMGILDISHGLYKTDESIYKELEETFNYEAINQEFLKNKIFKEVEKKKSFYQITKFGSSFMQSCTE